MIIVSNLELIVDFVFLVRVEGHYGLSLLMIPWIPHYPGTTFKPGYIIFYLPIAIVGCYNVYAVHLAQTSLADGFHFSSQSRAKTLRFSRRFVTCHCGWWGLLAILSALKCLESPP